MEWVDRPPHYFMEGTIGQVVRVLNIQTRMVQSGRLVSVREDKSGPDTIPTPGGGWRWNVKVWVTLEGGG